MAFFDYVDNLQSFLALVFIQLEGAFFALIKTFKLTDAIDAFRILRLLCYPAFLFREIALTKYSTATWAPLLIAFMVQLTVHALIGVAALILRKERRARFFLRHICTYGYCSLAPHGSIMMSTLMSGQNKHILAMMCLVQSLFMRPLHVYMHLRHAAPELPLENVDNDASNSGDGGEPVSDQPQSRFTGTFGWEMFHALLSTQNICFLFGMIWAATKWVFPKFIETITTYSENSIPCATLFFFGVIFANHPFLGCKYLKVIIYLFIHFVIIPFIAVLWCWAFHIDKSVMRVMVALYSLPIDNIGLEILNFDDPMSVKYNTATYTILYSHILGFPLLLCWLALINKTSIF